VGRVNRNIKGVDFPIGKTPIYEGVDPLTIGFRGIERPDPVSTELAILRVPISRQAKGEVAREDTCGY
jgi:hypothetical protein